MPKKLPVAKSISRHNLKVMEKWPRGKLLNFCFSCKGETVPNGMQIWMLTDDELLNYASAIIEEGK